MKRVLIAACLGAFALVSCQSGKKDVFQKESEALNKQCPMMVDLQTRMDSTRYHKEKLTFSYYYTLKDVYRDSLFLAQTPAEMEVNMIEALRNSAEFRAYQAAGITMQYVYFAAETGKELFRIDIPANRY